jgi:triosephosphate isomerase
MNGTTAALAEVEALTAGFSAPECELLLCPPATLIARVIEVAKGSVLKVIVLSA